MLIKKSNKLVVITSYSTHGLAGQAEEPPEGLYKQKVGWCFMEKRDIVAQHVLKATSKKSGLYWVKLCIGLDYSHVHNC